MCIRDRSISITSWNTVAASLLWQAQSILPPSTCLLYTSILIENTETRDQPKNKENAMRQLRSILYDKELQHRMEEQDKVEAVSYTHLPLLRV